MSNERLALADEQEVAVEAILEWFRNGDDAKKVFKLHGYAGTGKTTVLKEVVRRLRQEHGDLRLHFAAPTNKAAAVMRSKGLTGATTLHSAGLIWELRTSRRTGASYFHPLDKGSAELDGIDLLILDECSMVSAEWAARVLYHPDGGDLFNCLATGGGRRANLRVLAVGDPAQLWPVKSETPSPWATEGKHDARLETIHRTVSGSRVLRGASAVRDPAARDYGRMWDLLGLGAQRDMSALLAADQVIAYTNETRWHIIDLIRSAKGMPDGEPAKGDRLVVLENGNVGVKGDQVEVASAVRRTMPASDKGGWREFDYFHIRLTDGRHVKVPVHMFAGFDGEKVGIWNYRPSGVESLTFADAITCHKAQGSEWDNVLIVDEGWLSQSSEGWYYTAITRARKEAAVIKAKDLPSRWTLNEARALRSEWDDAIRKDYTGAGYDTALGIVAELADSNSIRVDVDPEVVAERVGRSVSTVKTHMTKLRKAGYLKGKGDLTMLDFPSGVKRPGLVAQLYEKMARQALPGAGLKGEV